MSGLYVKVQFEGGGQMPMVEIVVAAACTPVFFDCNKLQFRQ
jgi:hypothetical protein